MKRRSGKKKAGKVRRRVQPGRGRPKSPPAPARGVFLVGFMGAGKTSVGRALGQHLNWAFEDLDDRIERREGRKVAQIFDESGESEFRRAEHEALRDLLQERRSIGYIVALGGGAFVQKRNSALLKKSGVPTVFLDAAIDELWQRCCRQAKAAGTERPLLRSLEQFRKLYQSRSKAYAKATLTISTNDRAVEEIAAEIAESLGLKKIAVRVEKGEVE